MYDRQRIDRLDVLDATYTTDGWVHAFECGFQAPLDRFPGAQECMLWICRFRGGWVRSKT